MLSRINSFSQSFLYILIKFLKASDWLDSADAQLYATFDWKSNDDDDDDDDDDD